MFGETTRDVCEELMDLAGLKGAEREAWAIRLGTARLLDAVELMEDLEQSEEAARGEA